MADSTVDIVYYVACSLDGFIAEPDGSVEWLNAYHGSGEDYGMEEFTDSCESLVMGSYTNEVSSSFGEWQSKDKRTWVFTNRDLPVAHESISFTNEPLDDVVREMASNGVKRAWLLGGGKLAASFIKAGLLTEIRVFIIPILLGDGIPLFSGVTTQQNLRLDGTKSFNNGVVELRYVPATDDSD